MTALEHAILATIVLFVFHKWGEMKGRKERVESVIENTLDSLESNGFIIMETNELGEKELIKVQKKC